MNIAGYDIDWTTDLSALPASVAREAQRQFVMASNYVPDVVATHLPMLLAAILHTTGPVLELSCGEYSTMCLHYVCRAQGRRLVTVEHRAPWLRRFLSLASPNHELVLTDDWGGGWWLGEHWDVAFVDNDPDAERELNVNRVRQIARLVVVHDTHPTSKYAFEPQLAGYRYRYDFTRYPWHTAVVSMTDDLAWLETR